MLLFCAAQRRPPGAQQDQDAGDAIEQNDIFSLWRDLEHALHASGGGLPQLPELRSAQQDWVRDGLKLPGYATTGRLAQAHEQGHT